MTYSHPGCHTTFTDIKDTLTIDLSSEDGDILQKKKKPTLKYISMTMSAM